MVDDIYMFFRNCPISFNAATWVLLLTGQRVVTRSEVNLSTVLKRLLGKGGDPLV
jgi:RHH-type transcriptional regulator, proline utilization regulon repressor / proline dehydrogenase / delta 1-pyrroline-5-carboxylate dehydrogenase